MKNTKFLFDESKTPEEEMNVYMLSYGKDSIAGLHVAIDLLGWQVDKIAHAEVWATDTIQADLPPMVEFKKRADQEIFRRWGLEVEHARAKDTFESFFYRPFGKSLKGEVTPFTGKIHAFPLLKGSWCLRQLKLAALNKTCNRNDVQILGIAADEIERANRHGAKENVLLPLVEAGWTESDCRKWCEENDLLSPIYTTSTRGGCWFCPKQSVGQLRLLRHEYPELWALMLKWDWDARRDMSITFKPRHTLADYEERFKLEDAGLVPSDLRFKWNMLDANVRDAYLSKHKIKEKDDEKH